MARADGATSTGPEKLRIRLNRQANRLHVFAGHCKDSDGNPERWEAIKVSRQRNDARKTAFLRDHALIEEMG